MGPQVVAPQQQIAGQDQPVLNAALHQAPMEWLPRLKCNKCSYETNNQIELIYHVEKNHQQPNLKCDECPQSFRNGEALVLHIVQAHTGQRERNLLNNGVWTCSFCGQVFSGNQARDNHTCGHHPAQLPSLGPAQQQQGTRDSSQEDCNRGPQCRFLWLGTCHFRHADNVENVGQPHVSRRNTGRKDMWCSFQDKCKRRQTCVYKHLEDERDFLQTILRRTEM